MRTTMPLISLAILASATATAQAAPAAGIVGILNGTPWWVYALLSVLIYSGIQAAKPRSWPLARVAIVPLAFAAWGVASLVLTPFLSLGLVATCVATAGVGGGLAALTWRSDRVQIDRIAGRVRLPASWVPLARNLAIFAAKYAIAVAGALSPEVRSQLAFWDIAVSGLSAGYFLGWLAHLAALYFTPPARGSRPDSNSESAAVEARPEQGSTLYRDRLAAMQDKMAQMFRNDVSLFGRSLP